jgi:hypothetical protein
MGWPGIFTDPNTAYSSAAMCIPSTFPSDRPLRDYQG